MADSNNRILAGMDEWKRKEAQMKGAVEQDIITREKLRHYEKLSEIKPANSDERFALDVLKREIKSLERKVYPDRLVRLFIKTGKSPNNDIKHIYGNTKSKKSEVVSWTNELLPKNDRRKTFARYKMGQKGSDDLLMKNRTQSKGKRL